MSRRAGEGAIFFGVIAILLTLWFGSGGAGEVFEDEQANVSASAVAISVLVLAGAATSGFVTRDWDVIIVILAVPAVLLAAWSVIVLASDGDVLWDDSSPGLPAMLSIAFYPVVLAVAVGVVCGRLRHRYANGA